MMMEQDLFALPKTQMSVDWKNTLLSNLQDIDNLLKKCSFKHNVLLLLEDSWPFMNQWHSLYGAKCCTDKTILGP